MKSFKLPRIMLVGTGSGCGKTTITCGLLSAFKRKNIDLAAFKCGPDYIDPMFHREALGINSFNLDLVLTGEKGVEYILGERGKNKDLTIIEGVMGMYDGQKNTDYGSSNHIAILTNTPEILIVSPKGVGLSVAATVKGYVEFRKNNIKGVILNNISQGMYPYYKEIIEENTKVKVLGFLPKDESLIIESRHLGLVTAGEIDNINQKLINLGNTCEKTVDMEAIMEIAKSAEDFYYEKIDIEKVTERKVKIALAWDKAFCFYYEDSLKILEDMGAEIVKFSPLKDKQLPKDIGGLIIPGGYPELYGKELEDNISIKTEIKNIIEKGLPTIAECGGYMYLCKSLESLEAKEYSMVGVIDHRAKMTGKLVRFGYGILEAKGNGLLADKGENLLVHEFHYSDTDKSGEAFELKKGKISFPCGIGNTSLYAAYPHLHFVGNLQGAKRFVQAAKVWEEQWS